MGYGWGTAVGWIFGQLQSKEERRRNAYAKLKKKREAIVKKPWTEARGRQLADIDRRMRDLADKAIAQ